VKGPGHIGQESNNKSTVRRQEERIRDKRYTRTRNNWSASRYSLFCKETEKISNFIDDEGVIEIYSKHPLVKKYMRMKNFKNRPEFLIFIADTITREAVKAFVLSGVRENSSRFEIFDIDHPESDIEGHITHEYYEQGPKLHEIFVDLARTLKVAD